MLCTTSSENKFKRKYRQYGPCFQTVFPFLMTMINNDISIPKKVINTYISYILNAWLRTLNTDFTLNNCLFGSVRLTKNAYLDKYKYSGYDIGFDSRSEFLFTEASKRKNVILCGAYMSSSVHIDNNNKDILILRERPTQGLDDTTLTHFSPVSNFYTP